LTLRAQTAAALLVLGAATADGGADLARVVRNVDRRFARKYFALAATAEAAGFNATARDLRARVLALQPHHRRARQALGYRREAGRWVRDGAAAAALEGLEDREPDPEEVRDGDAFSAALVREQAAALEQERIAEIVRVALRYGTPAERRRVLEPLVRRHPGNAALHEALGHERLGDGWVRPALRELAARRPAVLAKWRALAKAPVKLDLAMAPPALPGVAPKSIAVLRCRDRLVATTLEARRAAPLAQLAERTQRFLVHLLGPGPGWDPSLVVFLKAADYTALVRALHEDDRTFRLYHRYDNYEHPDFYAIRCRAFVSGLERYAHGAAHLTAFERAAPETADEGRDARAYAWWREGLGYLAALELTDRAYVDFVSLHESTGKRRFTRPPPKTRTAEECRRWLREQVVAGRAHRLRAVCGMSLNSLDFCAAMQACSFVRFLALYDPEAFRALPAALRRRADGPALRRTDAALEEAFGKGIAGLEPLWRAFVVELGPAVE